MKIASPLSPAQTSDFDELSQAELADVSHASRSVEPCTVMARTILATALTVILCAGCRQAVTSQTAQAARPVVMTKSGIEMVLVPDGSFTMGSERGAAEEAPRHRVSVDSFLIDRYEITQEEYEKLVIGNPSKFKDPKHPVERVRWVEAALYCNARSTSEGLEPCYDENTYACKFTANGYRLPTEAEWEYACRAGTEGEYWFGSDASRLGDYAWCRDNASERTHPVGTKRPNPWGLYDMSGNVGEWCQDTFDGQFYRASTEKNPCGSSTGPRRALRGGAWNSSADRCRSAGRSGEEPGNFADACFARADIGFRCVRRALDQPPADKVAQSDSAGLPENAARTAGSSKRP